MESDMVLKGKRNEIFRIAASHGVRDLCLFGSSARAEAGPDSDIDIGERHSPICASAASAWGSQNVISMARYNSMAMDSSA